MLFEMQDIFFEFYRDMPNGKVSTTPINRSNFTNSFHSFEKRIFFTKTTCNNMLNVKIWWSFGDFFNRFYACTYVMKMCKLASSTTLKSGKNVKYSLQ